MSKIEQELQKLGVPAPLARLRSWDWSEVSKLLIQTLVTPLTLGVFSYFLSGKVDKAQQGFLTQVQTQIQSSAASAEDKAKHQRAEEEQQRHKQQVQEALHGKRMWVWDQISLDLYDIRCYMLALPACAELSLGDILARKQRCDFVVSAYRDFLPEVLVSAYGAFSDSAFATSTDPAAPTTVRASYVNRALDKKKPQKQVFAYGKDVQAALTQQKVIEEKWEALRAAVSQMLAPPA